MVYKDVVFRTSEKNALKIPETDDLLSRTSPQHFQLSLPTPTEKCACLTTNRKSELQLTDFPFTTSTSSVLVTPV